MFVVSSHKLFMELLREEERKVLVEQMRKRSATINLSAKPLPSFYDIPGAGLKFSCTHHSIIPCQNGASGVYQGWDFLYFGLSFNSFG